MVDGTYSWQGLITSVIPDGHPEWADDQPGYGSEECISSHYSYKWHDHDCPDKFPFLCETDL